MKLKVGRGKIFIATILILLVIFSIIGFSLVKKKVEEPYIKMFQYCSEQQIDNEKIKVCRVLISDFYQQGKSKKCMEVVVPEQNLSEKTLTLCCRDNVFEQWQNPYNSYVLDIPVILNISYRKFPIISFRNVEIELMSDEEAHEVFDPVNSQTENIILFRSSAATKEITDKGYYFSSRMCPGDFEEICQVLGVYEVELSQYSVRDNILEFQVNMIIYGQEKSELLKVESFQFEKYSYSEVGKPLISEKLDINKSLEDFLSTGESYVMEFSVSNYEELTDEIIEQYSEGVIDLELNLERVFLYVE